MSQGLEVCGQVQQPGRFDFEALARLPGQIEDISTMVPGRTGGGVRLASLVAAVQPLPEATHITVQSNDGSFSASVPLAAVVESGVVLYRLGVQALPEQQGGPFRFLITDAQTCATGGADLCANVKFVGRLALSAGPGYTAGGAAQGVAKGEHVTTRYDAWLLRQISAKRAMELGEWPA